MKLIWLTLVIRGRSILLNHDNHFTQQNMPNLLDSKFSQRKFNEFKIRFTVHNPCLGKGYGRFLSDFKATFQLTSFLLRTLEKLSKRDQGIAKYQMLNTKVERTNMNPIVPRGISRFKIRDFKSLYLYFFFIFQNNLHFL